jgi:hypothetical protein
MKKAEIKNVKPLLQQHNVVCSTSLHDFILKNILSFSVNIKEVKEDEFHQWYEECSINYEKREIEVQICKDEINWIKEGKLKFASKCYVDVESIVKGFALKGEYIDAYVSIIVDNELLLNNYDAVFEEQDKNEKGFCNVLGFATITNKGIVRFSQVVYSFLFNKLIIRDDITFQLPFKPNLKNDFGGKRATYRTGCKLSLRTNMSVYKKVDKKYWQPDSRKNDLSYPRLVLS